MQAVTSHRTAVPTETLAKVKGLVTIVLRKSYERHSEGSLRKSYQKFRESHTKVLRMSYESPTYLLKTLYAFCKAN